MDIRHYFRIAIASTLIFALAGWLQTSQAQEVESDYEIVQGYKTTYKSLQNSLDTVSTVSGAETLVSRIDDMDEEYSDNEELLNKALYPDNYEDQIRQLSKQAKATLDRLEVIAKQEKRLDNLTGRVGKYDKQLQNLQTRADSLQNVISQANQRNRQLSGAVRNYRANVKKRDDLILSIMDTLVANYQQMDSQTLKELSMAYKESRKNIDNNALKLLESIARTNVEFLNSTATLSTRDYLRMYSVQQSFRDMWSKVGDEILQIYAPDEGSEAVESELKNALNEWETKVADQTWKSMNKAFDEQGISLQEFGDSEGFYNSLTTYISDNTKKGGSTEAHEEYEKFTQFWNNTVKANWAQYITGTNILSFEQMASIDQELTEWETKSTPPTYLWKVLVAIAVLIIIVLSIMLARSRSQTTT